VKILITGAGGQIGHDLIGALVAAGHQVVSTDLAPRPPSHAHAGSVFAYVLSGKVRSENSVTGPARVYEAGEGFFEPPGSTHTISENASDTEPASLLAIFVADDGAQLTRGAADKQPDK